MYEDKYQVKKSEEKNVSCMRLELSIAFKDISNLYLSSYKSQYKLNKFFDYLNNQLTKTLRTYFMRYISIDSNRIIL